MKNQVSFNPKYKLYSSYNRHDACLIYSRVFDNICPSFAQPVLLKIKVLQMVL